MAKREKLKINVSILAENLKSLRKQALLTINGIDAYTNQSSDHIRQLENKENKVTPNINTLLPYSILYKVTVDDLWKKRNLKLGSDLTELETFRRLNKDFKEYFIDTLSIPDFIRLKVFSLPKMKEGMKVNEIIASFPDENIESKALSRELTRLVEKGLLTKKDPNGTGAAYIYKLK